MDTRKCSLLSHNLNHNKYIFLRKQCSQCIKVFKIFENKKIWQCNWLECIETEQNLTNIDNTFVLGRHAFNLSVFMKCIHLNFKTFTNQNIFKIRLLQNLIACTKCIISRSINIIWNIFLTINTNRSKKCPFLSNEKRKNAFVCTSIFVYQWNKL